MVETGHRQSADVVVVQRPEETSGNNRSVTFHTKQLQFKGRIYSFPVMCSNILFQIDSHDVAP